VPFARHLSRCTPPLRNRRRSRSTSSTGDRPPHQYAKVDADTGEEVANEDIVKGYKVDTDTFVEVTKEELENVALPVAIKKSPVPRSELR
jgi:hypothetical protein